MVATTSVAIVKRPGCRTTRPYNFKHVFRRSNLAWVSHVLTWSLTCGLLKAPLSCYHGAKLQSWGEVNYGSGIYCLVEEDKAVK